MCPRQCAQRTVASPVLCGGWVQFWVLQASYGASSILCLGESFWREEHDLFRSRGGQASQDVVLPRGVNEKINGLRRTYAFY